MNIMNKRLLFVIAGLVALAGVAVVLLGIGTATTDRRTKAPETEQPPDTTTPDDPKAYDTSTPIYDTDDCLEEASRPSDIARERPYSDPEHLVYDEDECAYFRPDWKKYLEEAGLMDCPSGCILPSATGYDKFGRKTRVITYDGEGNLAGREKFKYDSRDKLIHRANYDPAGNLLKLREYVNSYHLQNNLVKSVSYLDGYLLSVTVYSYDAAGRQLESFACRGSGDLWSREIFTSKPASYHDYRKDAASGNIVETINLTTKDDRGLARKIRIVKQYDEGGYLVKEEAYDVLDRLLYENNYTQESRFDNPNILTVANELCPYSMIQRELESFDKEE